MAARKMKKGPRFVVFFGPVLEVLRELGGSGTPQEVKTASFHLRKLRHFADLDEMVREYDDVTEAERRQLIAEAYKVITGGDIEQRLRELTID